MKPDGLGEESEGVKGQVQKNCSRDLLGSDHGVLHIRDGLRMYGSEKGQFYVYMYCKYYTCMYLYVGT